MQQNSSDPSEISQKMLQKHRSLQAADVYEARYARDGNFRLQRHTLRGRRSLETFGLSWIIVHDVFIGVLLIRLESRQHERSYFFNF